MYEGLCEGLCEGVCEGNSCGFLGEGGGVGLLVTCMYTCFAFYVLLACLRGWGAWCFMIPRPWCCDWFGLAWCCDFLRL